MELLFFSVLYIQKTESEMIDLRSDECLFQDYVNEFLALLCSAAGDSMLMRAQDATFVHIRNALQQEPLPSVEWRMKRLLGRQAEEFLSRYSEKVVRLERVIGVMNACEDETIFYQAANELFRLLYGEAEEYPYPGEQYHPDLFKLE